MELDFSCLECMKAYFSESFGSPKQNRSSPTSFCRSMLASFPASNSREMPPGHIDKGAQGAPSFAKIDQTKLDLQTTEY